MFTFAYIGIFIVRFSCSLNGVIGKNEISFNIGAGENRRVININGNSSYVVSVRNIPPSVAAVLFQVHSHGYNMTLSEAEEESIHYSITGRNIGMIYRLHTWESEAHMWLINRVQQKLSALIIISDLDSYDPIPGGCNMEFPTEIAPYLKLRSDTGKIYVEYQHANIGALRDEPVPLCSHSLSYITYDVYVFYMEENDFGQEEYFSKINTMSNASLIKKSANKVLSYSLHPDTRFSFFMYPNIGVVYNIIAKYTVNGIVKEALYVPITSYGCGSFEFTEYGCNFPYSFEAKAFLFLLSLYGFITAYFGHLFYGSTMFFFGFLAAFFITLILLGRFSSFSKSKILKFCGLSGILGGAVWLLLWILLRSSTISLLLVGFLFGFLLSATIMYSPLGNYEINLNDKNYWLLLATGSLLVTVILLSFPTVLSILGSSIVGCYIMILFYDDFLGTRLAYIILNIVKRARSDNLEFATNDFPFQIKDALICCAWIVLSILAVVVQSRSLKSSDDMNVCFCKRRSNSRNPFQSECDPHQPLCTNNDPVFYNTFPK